MLSANYDALGGLLSFIEVRSSNRFVNMFEVLSQSWKNNIHASTNVFHAKHELLLKQQKNYWSVVPDCWLAVCCTMSAGQLDSHYKKGLHYRKTVIGKRGAAKYFSSTTNKKVFVFLWFHFSSWNCRWFCIWWMCFLSEFYILSRPQTRLKLLLLKTRMTYSRRGMSFSANFFSG